MPSLPLRLAVFVPFLLLASGCRQSLDDTVGGIFSSPVPIRAEPHPLAEGERDLAFRYPDLKNPDGSTTRILWLNPGLATSLNVLLTGNPVWVAAAPKAMATPNVPFPSLFRDPNIGAYKEPGTTMGIQGWKDHSGLEPLILSGTAEAVEAATALVTHVLSSIPQISIEARVVEVLEGEDFAFGTNWYLLNREDHPFDPLHPNAPLQSTDTVFDRSNLGRGVPTLPGSNLFTPNVLTELGTIQDDIQIDLLISALKSFTKVDVVNAPNVAVLSGHTASITAGTEIPYFDLQIVGASAVVATKFKKIGVTLDVLPNLIRPDTIRMAVQVKVDNITGGITVTGGGTSVTNPIIASRTVTTTMDVRDGATVILGGLISTGRTGVDDRVPVLGDIPILEFLFSSRHDQDTRSNLIFFLRPKIFVTGGPSSPALIMPSEEPEAPGQGPPGQEPPPEKR